MKNYEGTNLIVRHFWDEQLYGIIATHHPKGLSLNNNVQLIPVLCVDLSDIADSEIEYVDGEYMQWQSEEHEREMHGEVIGYYGKYQQWLTDICGTEGMESVYITNAAIVDDGNRLRIVTYDWFKELGLVFLLTKLGE